METLSTLLALCEGNHWSKVNSPLRGPVIWTFHLFFLFTPQPKLGSRGIVVIRRAGRRAWPQHRYRSHGRSSYPIAVKLGRDEPWGRTSDEFVLGRRGSLIKRLTSWLRILTCQARYRSHGRSSYPIAVKLGRDQPWGRTSDEFLLGGRGSLIKRLTS